MESLTVKELPPSERPYEKCMKYGVDKLSDAELLAVILRTGTKGISSLALAQTVLRRCRKQSISGLYDMEIDELKEISGIGAVKALQIKCLTEFSKRLWREKNASKNFFRSANDIANYYMEHMRHLDHEEVIVMMLDNKCAFTGDFRLSSGSVNASVVSVRDVFMRAARHGAVQIVLVHNHPSGDPSPSEDDILVSQKISDAGSLLEIRLSDSIVIGDGNYISLRSKGLIKM